MGRTSWRSLLAVTLTMLVSPVWAAAGPQNALLSAERSARVDAVHQLCRKVIALRVDDKTALADLLAENKGLRSDATPLVTGAVETRPARCHADGTCEVRAAIPLARVIQNLRTVVPKHAHRLSSLAAQAKSDTVEASGEGSAGVPDGREGASSRKADAGALAVHQVPGWQGVSAKSRLERDHRAYLAALAKLKTQVYAVRTDPKSTVKDFASRSEKAGAALSAFLGDIRASRKAYLPNGIVEVELSLQATKLLTALTRINKEVLDAKSRAPESVLADAQKAIEGQAFTVFGYAGADREPVAEQAVYRQVAIDFGPMPKITLKELEAPK